MIAKILALIAAIEAGDWATVLTIIASIITGTANGQLKASDLAAFRTHCAAFKAP